MFLMIKKNSENYVKYTPLSVFFFYYFWPQLTAGPLLIF
jgi:hypothetical protein